MGRPPGQFSADSLANTAPVASSRSHEDAWIYTVGEIEDEFIHEGPKKDVKSFLEQT